MRDEVRTKSRSNVQSHSSDCATHNMPALPAGPCDCGAGDEHDAWARDQWDKIFSAGVTSAARREQRRQARAMIADLRRRLHARAAGIQDIIRDHRPVYTPAWVASGMAAGSSDCDHRIRAAVRTALHERDDRWSRLVDQLVSELSSR